MHNDRALPDCFSPLSGPGEQDRPEYGSAQVSSHPLPSTEQFPGESAGGRTAECTEVSRCPNPQTGWSMSRSALRSLLMTFKRKLVRAAICLVAFLIFLAIPGKATAQSTCSPSNVTALDGGLYHFQMNEWNSSLPECASINGIGFDITTANFDSATNGAPATYTSIYRGCHWETAPVPIRFLFRRAISLRRHRP